MINKHLSLWLFDQLANRFIPSEARRLITRARDMGSVEEYKRFIKTYICEQINYTLKSYLTEKRLPPTFLEFTIKDDGRISFIYRQFAQFLRVDRRILDVRVGNASFIRPTKEGFIIYIKRSKHQRMLTELSHEIGHTYLYEAGCAVSMPLCITCAPDEPAYVLWKIQEGLAYELGREVLLPRYAFLDYVERRGREPSLETFLTMLKELKVSKLVLAKRLVHELKAWDVGICWGHITDGKADVDISRNVVVGSTLKRYAIAGGLSRLVCNIVMDTFKRGPRNVHDEVFRGTRTVRRRKGGYASVEYELKMFSHVQRDSHTSFICLIYPRK